MKHKLSHEIDNYPESDDAGTIRVTAKIFGQDDNSTFTTLSLAKDFIDDENEECKSKEDLNYFLLEAGITEDVINNAILELIVYVDEVTCPASIEYSPGCALNVRLDLVPDYLDDDDDSEIQEAAQVSFDDTSNIRFGPASKLVVKSLPRKVYNKKIKKEKKKNKKMVSLEECRICLQEFSNGGMVVTLSCGHEFDEECIVKWFETSHVCSLCRLELPCQDDEL
ncbi:E3 ubiquitin-protein ligase RNF181-like [Brassica napus]|uniref:E3 ubiquitin-protein ligase RNF181-like n=1 Tax=Brassica napus TaxID=3708 RepID=UPI00207ADADB|nr:E3 ubiquitin-protein ligase RNF181-like [Brassica napus]